LDRDQNDDRLERIIGQRLADGRCAGDAQCPDASIIAAYRERSLPREERAQCERHFAQCARCASALAALARIDDAIEHGGVAATRSAGNDSRVWWRLRGPLPLAAFAAIASFVIVVAIRTFSTPHQQRAVAARSELEAKSLAGSSAAAKSGSNALGSSNSVLAMNQPAPTMPASPPLRKSFATRVPPPPSEGTPMAQRYPPPPPEMASAAREQTPRSSRDKLKERHQRVVERDRQTAEVAAAPMAAPEASPAAAGTANGAFAGDIAGASATVAPSSAGVPSNVTGGGVGSRAAASGAASSTVSDMAAAIVGPMPGANANVVEPPDHTVVWMVGAHGAVSRYSVATGWVPQTSGVTADLSGGSAPSATTCWIVGRAGTILRTVDGERWTTVVAPVNADLIGVIARSASDATIVATGGRRFATSDGGATWRPM
jgi:hypothetical protein